jgi:hypothetical protein
MSEATSPIERDQRGRFLTGTKAGPGRSKGSRNKVTEDFLRDAYIVWQERGITSLRECTHEQFLRTIVAITPKEAVLDVSVGVNLADVSDTLELYRRMAEMLGANAAPGLRKLKRMEIIDADPV